MGRENPFFALHYYNTLGSVDIFSSAKQIPFDMTLERVITV